MKTLLRFIKQWQLRRAREKYAAAKARRTVLEHADLQCSKFIFKIQLVEAAAEEAKLEERVESLMREQL